LSLKTAIVIDNDAYVKSNSSFQSSTSDLTDVFA